MKYDLKNKYKHQAVKERLQQLIDSGAYIELREIKMKRNLDQNGLYWLWLSVIEREYGLPKEQLHHMYRAMFLMREDEHILKIIKEKVWYRAKDLILQFHYEPIFSEFIDLFSYSTTELNVSEFSEYLTKIKQHAKKYLGILLVNLEDESFLEFYKEYYRN